MVYSILYHYEIQNCRWAILRSFREHDCRFSTRTSPGESDPVRPRTAPTVLAHLQEHKYECFLSIDIYRISWRRWKTLRLSLIYGVELFEVAAVFRTLCEKSIIRMQKPSMQSYRLPFDQYQPCSPKEDKFCSRTILNQGKNSKQLFKPKMSFFKVWSWV